MLAGVIGIPKSRALSHIIITNWIHTTVDVHTFYESSHSQHESTKQLCQFFSRPKILLVLFRSNVNEQKRRLQNLLINWVV